ncbi:hypothetical protein ANSO36C_63370 (plasmid) [Nostoc cf. commune SO-36]|uniref:Uncharacterized protein n=1 Tax=Nostoc cf. commune SO-36 TaxID=449208 RepID=A0ABM7ZB96_NOSCO|nr:DUF6753 family protein [Nostoc commune]BDI20535.1 hypothetical protein ANSO36C_63370 [Nostoc cf. commune SO-36]
MRTSEILQGYSEAEQQRIVETAQQIGLAEDDPMFQVMATLGRYEETMISLQARMEAMIEAWVLTIEEKVANTSKTAQSMNNTVVSNAVRDVLTEQMPLLIQSSTSSASSPPKEMRLSPGNFQMHFWSICALVGGVTAAGAMLASFTTWNVMTNLGQNQSVMLSNNDLKILQWVKSSEGKQTYKLFVDNQQTLAACQEENRLKGYCLIQMQKNKK